MIQLSGGYSILILTISFDVHSGAVVKHAVVVGGEDVNGGVEPRGEDDEPEEEADDANDQASQTQVDTKTTFAQHFRHPRFCFFSVQSQKSIS